MLAFTLRAAARGHLDSSMAADHSLDKVNHEASRNSSAVKSVEPLIVQCRRFWYAYQHEGEIAEGARFNMELAQGIDTGDETAAMRGANAAVVGILGAALYTPVWTSAVLTPLDFALSLSGFLLLTVWKTLPLIVAALLVVATVSLRLI